MERLLAIIIICCMMWKTVEPHPNVAIEPSKNCKLKIGDTYEGGIVFYLQPGDACHGMVCAPYDQVAYADWKDAKGTCQSLHLDQYSDWRLPTEEELNQMYMNLYRCGLGGFSKAYYWSSTVDYNNLAYSQYFYYPDMNIYRFVKKGFLFHVRAVRSF